jgi:DNA-binding NtrC family response regulator
MAWMLLSRIGEMPERIAVVMLTAQGSIESAVEAMRLGAFDYIPKPVDPVRLKTILHNASRQRETDVELEPTRRLARDTGCWGRWWEIRPADEGDLQDDRAGRAVECAGAGDG